MCAHSNLKQKGKKVVVVEDQRESQSPYPLPFDESKNSHSAAQVSQKRR
jgi:hypothetical protein